MLLPRRSLPLVLALPVAVGSLAACSKDDGDGRRAATTTTSAPAGPPKVGVTITGTEANGTKAPDDATVAAVKATVDAWLATAVVAPLATGQPAGDLSAVFTPAALDRMAADPAARASLVDEGLPPASTSIRAERATVALSSVAGPDEVVAGIGARLDLLLRAQGPTLDVDVNHYGDLVLVQEGDSWKIDAFSVVAARDSREG